LPELSVVTVALAAPVMVIVTPLPLAVGLIVPEMVRFSGGSELPLEFEKPAQPMFARQERHRIARSALA